MLRHTLRKYQSAYSSILPLRFFSKDHRQKDFDYQQFEEERRQERQKQKNANKTYDHTSEADQQEYYQSQKINSKGGSIITLPPQIAKDLTLMNLPKYVSKDDLKKQYHKLAKIYHPDILHGKTAKLIPESQRNKLEDKFKEFNLAYERVLKWIAERDIQLDDDLLNNRRQGVTINKEDGSVTYNLGQLRIEGKRSSLDKQQILLDMVEEDLNMKEPVNFKRYLIIMWGICGLWVFYKDFLTYYNKMSKPRAGVNYSEYLNLSLKKLA